MSKKVQLKGYLVYTPVNKVPQFFIGGVASSCASEEVAQYGGFIVPLTGELDLQNFVTMYEEQADRYKELIRYETDTDHRNYWSYPKNPEKQFACVQELRETLFSIEQELEQAKRNVENQA